MVSLAYLITTLFILVAVSRGKDVTSAKGDINAKWFYMGVSAFVPFTTWNWSWYTVWPFGFNSFFGGTLFPSTFSMFFAKAVDEAHSVSRRTISLDDHEPLFRRDLPQTVTCYDEKGSPQQFYTADCAAYANITVNCDLLSSTNKTFLLSRAAQILHSQNFHTAHSGSCQVSSILIAHGMGMDKALIIPILRSFLSCLSCLLSLPKTKYTPKSCEPLILVSNLTTIRIRKLTALCDHFNAARNKQ
jgi:hypothetical protein